MFKKDAQRGRSKRRDEAYSISYVEALSDARTKLADFFNILLRNDRAWSASHARFTHGSTHTTA
jgi:hypothetical protein